MLRVPLYLIAAGLLIASVAGSSFAVDFVSDDNIDISNLHLIEDDLFAWGNTITIDGVVEGDMFLGGYDISTHGHGRKSANIFAYNYNHTGKIDGGLRTFARSLNIEGFVGGSMLLWGNSVTVNQNAVVERDAYIGGNFVRFAGTVQDKLKIMGENVTFSGFANGDVTIHGTKIKIVPPAVIKGNLIYTSKEEAEIDSAGGVTILGETTWNLPEENEKEEKAGASYTGIILSISKLLAAFLFGVILMFIARKYVVESVHQLRTRLAVATATGFLTLFIVAISMIVLILSLLMVVVGMVLVSSESMFAGAIIVALSTLLIPITCFASVSGGVLFYSGKIAVALLVGFLILGARKGGTTSISKLQLLVGLIIVAIVFAIPYVGYVLYILVSIIGAGAFILGIRHCQEAVLRAERREMAETDASGSPPAS